MAQLIRPIRYGDDRERTVHLRPNDRAGVVVPPPVQRPGGPRGGARQRYGVWMIGAIALCGLISAIRLSGDTADNASVSGQPATISLAVVADGRLAVTGTARRNRRRQSRLRTTPRAIGKRPCRGLQIRIKAVFQPPRRWETRQLARKTFGQIRLSRTLCQLNPRQLCARRHSSANRLGLARSRWYSGTGLVRQCTRTMDSS